MDDSIEITISINSDTFPLLYEYLNRIKPGRRRAAAFKRLAEHFLLLQEQHTGQLTLKTQQNMDGSSALSSDQADSNSAKASIPLDNHALRSSLTQFGFD